MNKFRLQIVTPKSVIYDGEIVSITAPGADGEITVLHNHAPLFSLLKEGVVTVRDGVDENFYSIGGGYLETSGKNVVLLVNRAYGQDELDESDIEQARIKAEKEVKEAPTKADREEALRVLKRSIIDMKILKKAKKKS